jgi:hypothetical protein
MWNKPYTLKEGFAIAVGLLLTGLALQMMVGPLDWDIFAWPGNIAVLFGLIVVLIVIYFMRKRFYFCSFLTTMQAAVPAMLLAVVLTIVMGLTKQVPSDKNPADPIGITKMLSFWPFVLEYVWMTVIVGEVTIHQLVEFKRRRIPSFVSHLGLFIVLTCSTLGSADMKRLKMFCEIGKPEWRGLDAWNNVHELDIALQLERFYHRRISSEVDDARPTRNSSTSEKTGHDYCRRKRWTARRMDNQNKEIHTRRHARCFIQDDW